MTHSHRARVLAAAAGIFGILGLTGCLEPIPQPEAAAITGAGGALRATGMPPESYTVFSFYDEDFQQGGFTFTYGGTTSVRAVEGDGAEGSEYFLRFNLDQKQFSGAAVCLWNMSFDLTPYMQTGALVVQARGKNGGEDVMIGLVDEETSDGKKTVVRQRLNKYGAIRQGEWTTFIIPLHSFGKRGLFWNAARGVEETEIFAYDNVVEVRIITNLGDNPEAVIDIDNIFIVADAVPPPAPGAGVDWHDLDQNIEGPTPDQLRLQDAIHTDFFVDALPDGGFAYYYGGDRTTSKLLPSTTPGNSNVLATYMVNDWSGVSLSLGANRTIDLTPIRRTGTLTFWVRGGRASTRFMVGLIDDTSDGPDRKVHTAVVGTDYGVVREGEWVQFRVPLRKFRDDGTFWDASQGREIAATIDWSKIQEFRISIGRDENRPGEGQPVVFYLDQIQVTKTAIGVHDDEAFWNEFQSDAPEISLFDFESDATNNWESAHGKTALISHTYVSNLPSGIPAPAQRLVRGNALRMEYRPGDWFDTFIQMANAPGVHRDFSRHWGISFWMYSDRAFQPIDVTIYDAGREFFITRTGAARGWNQVLVPFREFSKFPYYQRPDAQQNNRLDLTGGDGVFQVGFKPGGEMAGVILVDDIRLTNLREIQRIRGPAQASAVLRGRSETVVQPIAKIHGINVGLWAPELLEEAGLALHRPMGLQVVRYPGGLRSDEEDWRKTLRDKDFHVDTDEFLDWTKRAGVEAMFTVNVGNGTPEMAADWVRYVNQTRTQGPRVRYWEIGNELYGNWHKFYDRWGADGGRAYGRRVREYVEAMKAVDPDIQITAVWKLTGDWNRIVMEEAGDVIDGVNVHHYAQRTGAENDDALLTASAEIGDLMRDVEEQIKRYGRPGRNYVNWLSEWNSVDFNPGPQILQHINAVFVAEYIGNLAGSPVDIANLWALYNGRDRRLGDYGVLAVSADVQGLNATRPTYWAVRMMANSLIGDLLESSNDQSGSGLASWMSRRPDGKISIVFVNKNVDTRFDTRLDVPGLSGQATISTLVEANSYQGPATETRNLTTGSIVQLPTRSVVTIVFQ